MDKDLSLKPIAIGSLPHTNAKDAMELVSKLFYEIPFFPQLANVNKKEDMICQFMEGMPGFEPSFPEKFIFDMENEDFLLQLEGFFCDYEEVMGDINSPLLEKYAISDDFSSTFQYFKSIIKDTKPSYAKGQVTGAFTIATSLNDVSAKAAVFDETLRDIVVKLLSLKVMWIIKHIKNANNSTVPIIFMDEPSVSQIGTSAYVSVSEESVIQMISEISNIIQKNGGLSAIHCCGKCDWSVPIKSGVNIINFDAYSFFSNFSIYHNKIKEFLENGGKIAWGLVPTFDEQLLLNLKVEELENKFNDSVKYLTSMGIDEKLIKENSLITSSCGAGSLSVEGAEKAMVLIKELSDKLREKE